jgi:hypothetical protein
MHDKTGPAARRCYPSAKKKKINKKDNLVLFEAMHRDVC